MGGGEKGTGKRRGAAGGWREGDERERKEARWDQWARNAEGREREVEREGARGGSAAGQVRATATAVGGDRHGTSLAVGGVVDASCVARRDTAAVSSVGGGGSVEPPRDRRRRAHATAGGAANYNPSDLIWVDLQCVTPTFGRKMGRNVAQNCLNVQQHLGSFIPPRGLPHRRTSCASFPSCSATSPCWWRRRSFTLFSAIAISTWRLR